MAIDLASAYLLCGRVAAVWIIISSLERLAVSREFHSGGVFDPRVNLMYRAGRGSVALAGLVRRPVAANYVIHGVRITAGVTLLIGPDATVLAAASWIAVAAATFAGGWRRLFSGDDGSDQMLTIMSVTFAVALTAGTGALAAGLYFVAAQGCLAYAAAGIAKLVSPYWRSGAAIQGVLATRTYGLRPLSAAIQTSPRLARALCWGTILFETAFLAAPILPGTKLLALFAVAASFHLATALVMGLNGFTWSFVATYPAILFLNQSVRALG